MFAQALPARRDNRELLKTDQSRGRTRPMSSEPQSPAPTNSPAANDFDRLASLYGIGASYNDFKGDPQQIATTTKAAILSVMGVEASDPRAIDAAIAQQDTVHWMRMLPAVIVATQGRPTTVEVSIPLGLKAKEAKWTVTLETGATRTGSIALSKLEVLEKGALDKRKFTRARLDLPADLPLGYHALTVGLDTGLSGDSRLIIAPATSFEPAAIRRGGRVWGIAVQLYSLRSARNLGVGDFRDLYDLVELAAPLGCGIVGLNPLHALMPANPSHISPYSPSSREFLNVMYIAIEDVPEFADCQPAQQLVRSPEFQQTAAKLRSTDVVDYVGVAGLKFPALKLLYEHFRATQLDADTSRAQAFRRHVEERGEPLQRHATFDALDAHWRLQGPQYWGWPSWPEEYRDPTSIAVNRFARERARDIEYFVYLQWLAEEQLTRAQTRARELGMPIGLYGDVAVGANPGGSETWANRHLYLQNASVGAPPDALALKGQDWGIPPQNPEELKAQRYEPFIVMIRNNMRPVAALRLDHAMTLFRLWWVPRGMSSAQGAYVHYPLDDLIAILALESHRNECVVIGEDLGTVPEEVRLAMERYRIYHYKVLLFERELSGKFKAPNQYVTHALATVTTHDLPTLRGWWESHDIELRDELNLYPSTQVKDEVHRSRAAERVSMMQALNEHGLWGWQEHEPLPEFSPALARAIQAYLGLSSSNIAMLQIEDLIGMTEAVNVPGTDQEHANWQRKVKLDTAEILARDDVKDMLVAMNKARRGLNPNR
jgi:4-alpha-glucanotransferase